MKFEKIIPDYGDCWALITIYYADGVVHIVPDKVTAVGAHENNLVIRDVSSGDEPYVFECATPEQAQEQANLLRIRVRSAYAKNR